MGWPPGRPFDRRRCRRDHDSVALELEASERHRARPDALPVLAQEVEEDRGPVLATVEDLIRPEDRTPFLVAPSNLGDERRRDGAFGWWIFEDVAKPGRFVETFMLDSWIEHLRQHARVSNTDRELQERVRGFHIQGTPQVTHLIAVGG
jgi:hypothetical protein